MKRWRWTTVFSLLASTVFLGLPGATANAAPDDEKSAMEILRQMEIDMAAVQEHAAKLEQMAKWPNTYTKTSQEFEWGSMRQRFNAAGKTIPELQAAKDLAPWQKTIIDDISGVMKALDSQIESGIEILNETTTVEELHTNKLYPVRVHAVLRYTEMIDDLIESAESRYQTTS